MRDKLRSMRKRPPLPSFTLEVVGGEYTGDLVLDKPLRLLGRGRPRLLGSGAGSVVRVRAADVTVEGFDIDGRRGGDLSLDSAGVHSAAPRTTLRDLDIRATTILSALAWGGLVQSLAQRSKSSPISR